MIFFLMAFEMSMVHSRCLPMDGMLVFSPQEKIELLLIVTPHLQMLQWSVISKEAFLDIVNRSNQTFK